MTYVQYHGQCLPAHPVYPSSNQIAARIRQIIRDAENIARARKNPENFPTSLAFQLTGGILYLRSLKTLSNAGAASVKVATSVNNLKTCILGLKRAVPVRIGARRSTCFQPLQALFRIRVKTDRKSNF